MATKTRDEWATIFEPAEACVTAIYGLDDAPAHPHNVARGTFVTYDGIAAAGARAALQPHAAGRSRDGSAAREAFGLEG